MKRSSLDTVTKPCVMQWFRMWPVAAVIMILSVVITGQANAQSVIEPPTFWGTTVSNEYRVQADGQRLNVRRMDGRAGPASFVHVLMKGPIVFGIECPQAEGIWDIASTENLTQVERSETRLQFRIDRPSKILLQTNSDERLFIFVDSVPLPPSEMGPVTDVQSFGVDAAGARISTKEIQAAIDHVAAQPGGGVLHFRPGFYRSGTIRIKSNVTVYLAAGARLQGSEDPADYPFDPGTEEKPDRTQDIRSRLILFEDAENAALVGRGEIDGMGHIIRGQHRRVPNLIRVRRSKDIRIEGVVLMRSAGWNTHIFHSDDVRVSNIKSFSNWSDGLDADNSRDVHVSDVLISSYDDSFVVKATGFEGHADKVERISLDKAVLWTVKSCVKIGTETRADRMGDLSFTNVSIAGARGSLVIYARDGATIEDILYRDIDIMRAERALEWIIRHRHGRSEIDNVTLTNIQVFPSIPSILHGLDDDHDIDDVVIRNFRLAGQCVTSPAAGHFDMNDAVEEVEFHGCNAMIDEDDE